MYDIIWAVKLLLWHLKRAAVQELFRTERASLMRQRSEVSFNTTRLKSLSGEWAASHVK